MSYTTPKTWAYKEVLSSADMNTYITDNIIDLHNNGVLGYAEITNIFSTTATPTVTDVTNLAVTVTVPGGGRRIKITVFAEYMNSSATAGTDIVAYIREGTTTLTRILANTSTAGYAVPVNMVYVTAATAGSHTYKVSISQNAAGTLQLVAAATYPAFILVEYLNTV